MTKCTKTAMECNPQAKSCGSKKLCSFNYCAVAKFLIAIPAIPALGAIVSAAFADPQMKLVATAYSGAAAILIAIAIERMECLKRNKVPAMKFSHIKPADTEFKFGGLRDFFLYRDLGIAEATHGQVIAHLVKANPDMPPENGTGWHRHVCNFQIVVMTKGWAKFMYGDQPTLVEAGDVVHQYPGLVHYLYDYSPDMEYLEIVSPANFGTVDMPPATTDVPPVTPWK